MTRERALMLIGLLVIISPWSGLPLSWMEWILSGLGLAVIGIALILRPRTNSGSDGTPEIIPAVHTVPQQIVPESRSSNIAFS